jgi:hypothetical protein
MKTLSTIIIALISFSAIAADKDGNLSKIYNELRQHEEVFSMSVSKNMEDFFDMDFDLNGKEKWITGDFTKGKLLVVKKEGTPIDLMKLFIEENYEWVDLEDKTDEDEEKDEAYLFVARKGKHVSEANLVVVSEDTIVVVTVYGDIEVKNKK